MEPSSVNDMLIVDQSDFKVGKVLLSLEMYLDLEFN